MSLRSQRSAGSRRISTAPLSDAQVYTYTLKVAILQHAIANRPVAPASSSTGNALGTSYAAGSSTARDPVPKRESLRRSVTEATSYGSWSSGFSSALSLGDMFRSTDKGSSGGSPKYPEKFIKVLEQKIESISRGTDSTYTDMLLRYTIGAFYGKIKDSKNARTLKDSRKLEDLIMMFIATATEILRKRCPGDEWKTRLDSQVESFISILSDCLRNRDVRHVPQELFTKLDQLKSKMSTRPLPPPSQAVASARDDSFTSDRSSMDGHAGPSSVATARVASSSTIQFEVSEMPAVQQIGRLFGVDYQQLQDDVNSLKKVCTEKAAVADLKACVNLISTNSPFPGCREDFPTEEAYREWRSTELSSLQQAMLSIIQANPELVQSDDVSRTGGPDRSSVVTEAGEAYVGNRLSRQSNSYSTPIADQFSSLSVTPTASRTSSSAPSFVDEDGVNTPQTDVSELPSSSLTYIPPDTKQAYRRLLDIMLTHDLAAISDLDPSEDVPLRILSRIDQDILADCVLRWRITPTFQFTVFLEEMSKRYSAGEMPVVECVLEALGDFEKLDEQWKNENWPIHDRQATLYILSQIFDSLLRSFYETISEQQPGDAVPPILDAIHFVSDNSLFNEAVPPADLAERFEQLKDGIRRVSDFLYDREREAMFSPQNQDPSDPNGVQVLLGLLNWIKSTTKKLDKHYKTPLLGVVDVPQLFLERVPDIFIHELSQRLGAIAAKKKPQPLYTTPGESAPEDDGQLKDGEVMVLYTGVKELTDMHKAFCSDTPLQQSANQQFQPYILRWLAETDQKTLGWVRTAINLDEFAADIVSESNDGHSSSIVDLIASCKGAVQFVQDLGWPDEYENARFLTTLSATVSKAIEQYCIAIEELFMREMTPPKRSDSEDVNERTSAWITRAKALYQEKKLEQFQFRSTSCVKLNNIHAARNLLDKMYTAIDADKVAELTRVSGPPVPRKNQTSRNLFTIKVVLGEGLSTANGVSRVDPFVTLSDERGLRIAKTRTLYETTEPRWSETFDVSVEGKMWIAATVWDRNLVDEHELLGRSYICLDPAVFGDFLPHDMWQDLDTVGRLLLRVSMEGEKDDIQFYFGRAFRSLKRAENDMTRIIVDKISPFIRSCLSSNSLKSLMKKGGYGYFTNLKLDKAYERVRLENVRQLIQRKDPNAPEIPLPSDFTDINKPLPTATADKKKAPGLTDAEIEEPLGPLLEYLDQCLETFRKYLSEPAWQVVMTKIWKEVLNVTEALLVPALSDQSTEHKPLADKEVDIVFKWLKFLTDFFYADGSGVPIEDLRNPRYRAVMMIRLYYDWSTDSLMEESVRLTNQQMAMEASKASMTRSKSVYQQRNLGTIKQRKQEKHEDSDSGAAEMVMRILRMRPDALDFLQQQMGTLSLVQEKQKKPTRLLGSIRGRGKSRANRGGGSSRGGGGIGHRLNMSVNRLPPVPSPPPVEKKWNQYS